jgi:hypothetical protein
VVHRHGVGVKLIHHHFKGSLLIPVVEAVYELAARTKTNVLVVLVIALAGDSLPLPSETGIDPIVSLPPAIKPRAVVDVVVMSPDLLVIVSLKAIYDHVYGRKFI